MVDQLVAVLSHVDFLSPSGLSPRTVLQEPQKAEQLVEAPTIVSLIEVIPQPVEQTVDFPVGAGGIRPVEQTVDIPVPSLLSGVGGLQGFSQERVQQRVRSRPFTFQFRTVAGTTFILLQQRIIQIRGTTADRGFFRTFPRYKKVRRSRALSSARVPGSVSSWRA